MARPGETICSNCYAAIPAASTDCLRCGNAAQGQSPIEVRRKAKTQAIALSIGVAAGLFVIIWIIQWIVNGGLYKDNTQIQSPLEQRSVETSKPAPPSPPTGSGIAAGTNITLDGSGPDYDLNEVSVAVSEFYMDKYVEALRAKDFLGAYELSENHLIFHVPNGTYGLLLEMKPPKAKVRIYGPPDSRKNWKYFGQVGWVLSPMVKAQ
jgi:hypothetical protein